jgi:hypothetical protein
MERKAQRISDDRVGVGDERQTWLRRKEHGNEFDSVPNNTDNLLLEWNVEKFLLVLMITLLKHSGYYIYHLL